jgi:demethylspheroidene O-methyltransferase
MSGGERPDRATDVYFAFYTLAMGTGRTRSAAEIARHLRDAGFVDIETPRPRRSFVTSVVTARVGR